MHGGQFEADGFLAQQGFRFPGKIRWVFQEIRRQPGLGAEEIDILTGWIPHIKPGGQIGGHDLQSLDPVTVDIMDLGIRRIDDDDADRQCVKGASGLHQTGLFMGRLSQF